MLLSFVYKFTVVFHKFQNLKFFKGEIIVIQEIFFHLRQKMSSWIRTCEIKHDSRSQETVFQLEIRVFFCYWVNLGQIIVRKWGKYKVKGVNLITAKAIPEGSLAIQNRITVVTTLKSCSVSNSEKASTKSKRN